MNPRFTAPLFLIVIAVAGWVGCSSGSGQQGSIPAPPIVQSKAHRHQKLVDYGGIKHIFVIVQENRSLNNLFMGFPNANTQSFGGTSFGTIQQLQSVSLKNTQDIDHRWIDAVTAYANGTMTGFNEEYLQDCGSGSPSCPTAGPFPYAYVPKSETKPYWDIANSWILADNFFPTELGPSFTAHLNIIATTTEISPNKAIVDFPDPIQATWGCDDYSSTVTYTLTPTQTPKPNGPFPCFNQFHTVADLLDNATTASGVASPVPWRYYAPALNQSGSMWSAFSAIKKVYKKKDWANVISPQTKVLTDIPNGNLDNVGVVWVVPDSKDSDHAGSGSDSGPSWVANVVNTIGASKLWRSSVVVILWDDWGGWYDPVAPQQLDFRGLGLRTPMLILSPYAIEGSGSNLGYIATQRFEPGSIVRFMEQVWGLKSLESLNQYYSGYNSLHYTDLRSDSIGVTVNMSQYPRPFGTPIPTKYGSYYFLSETPSYSEPDSE
jgi:phospholipase C